MLCMQAEIEAFLDSLQQNGEASEQVEETEQVHSSQVALGKRKAAALPEAEPPAKVAKGSRNAAGETVFDLSRGRRVRSDIACFGMRRDI